ncbi:MAG: sigma-70 family RNA polymerase sigma factor [Planctomycetes bacterium]|nr:sigma-70 family RNA polymerase sigma factor [Planctomycetota bacterium]
MDASGAAAAGAGGCRAVGEGQGTHDGRAGNHRDSVADPDGRGRKPAAAHAPEEVWAAYERIGEQLRRVTYRVLRDGHEAEDAVHDAVLAAYHGIHSLRDNERLEGWLIRIARNTAATQVRKRRRCYPNTHAVDDSPPVGVPLARVARRFGSHEPSPEQVAAVRAAVDSLSAKLRTTMRDRVERGLSLAQIAAEQRVSLSCVKARVARIRERLHDCL